MLALPPLLLLFLLLLLLLPPLLLLPTLVSSRTEHIKSEKNILGKLYHPFIVTMYAFFQGESLLSWVGADETERCGVTWPGAAYFGFRHLP